MDRHVLRTLLLYKLHQTGIEQISPISKPLLKDRIRGYSLDTGLEFLDVVHNGSLTETNQWLPEHVRSVPNPSV